MGFFKKKDNTLSLKVSEAYTRDAGTKTVRIDFDSMNSLSMSEGDIIEIIGKRRTVAKCLSLFDSDKMKGIIRVNSYMRNNIGVDIDKTVTVRKMEAVPAEIVIVSPLEALQPTDDIIMVDRSISTGSMYLAHVLENELLINDDIVSVSYGGQNLNFRVVNIAPRHTVATDVVIVTPTTSFYIVV